jgi:uncharacterized damage-inducible protein DinB
MTNIRKRVDPPLRGAEADQLYGFLDYHRATLQMKAEGLDAAGLARSLSPSSMTLGGMLKHVAYVEDNWCSVFLHGNEMAAPWCDVDWKADPDWEWHSAASDPPDDLRALHESAVHRSRELVAGLDLDTLSVRRLHGADEPVALRWIVLHLIEEYARHNGHADLIRESIDGSVGE